MSNTAHTTRMESLLTQLDRTEPTGHARLRPVAPGLWATRPETLAGPVNTCGFLIERDDGNAFVYSSAAISDYYDHIDELGGVAMILLNHRDEAGSYVTALADRYGATVHTHRAEVDASHRHGVTQIAPLDGDTELGVDLQALHTPGHTPGVMSYLWHDPHDGLRYLFTGDTFNHASFERVTTIFTYHPYDDNAHDLRHTLLRVRDTDSDVLVPGIGWGDIDAYRWSNQQRHTLFNDLIAQLDATNDRSDTSLHAAP